MLSLIHNTQLCNRTAIMDNDRSVHEAQHSEYAYPVGRATKSPRTSTFGEDTAALPAIPDQLQALGLTTIPEDGLAALGTHCYETSVVQLSCPDLIHSAFTKAWGETHCICSGSCLLLALLHWSPLCHHSVQWLASLLVVPFHKDLPHDPCRVLHTSHA